MYHLNKYFDNYKEYMRLLIYEEMATIFRQNIVGRNLMNDLDLIRIFGQSHLPRLNDNNRNNNSININDNSGFPHYNSSVSWEIHSLEC